MPVDPGASIGHNITELKNFGSRPRPFKQRLAIALNVARKSGANIPQPGSALNSARRSNSGMPEAVSGPRAPSLGMPKPPGLPYAGLRR